MLIWRRRAARGALCNDGTPAVYYADDTLDAVLAAPASAAAPRRLLLFLEGGGFCVGEEGCLRRAARTPAHTTAPLLPSFDSPATDILGDASVFANFSRVFGARARALHS